MGKQKLASILLVLAGALILGSLYIWAPMCASHTMHCHRTGGFATVLAILVLALSLQSLVLPGKYWMIAIALGTAIILMPMTRAFGGGLCPMSSMRCHVTDWWLKLGGIIVIIAGILNALPHKK